MARAEIDLTTIQGGQRRQRFNRAGKIHTGLPSTDGKWGKEVPYFVLETADWWTARGVPPGSQGFLDEGGPGRLAAAEAVAKLYGPKPDFLECVFLSNRKGDNGPRACKKYGSEGFPICMGNREQALRWIDRGTDRAQQVVVDCPGPEECDFAVNEKGRIDCAEVSTFQLLIPMVDLWNIYQVDTKSVNADINYDAWHGQVEKIAGKVEGVPVILSRPPKKSMSPIGRGVVHYPIQFHSPDNASMKKILGRFYSVRNWFMGIEQKVAPAALPGPRPALPGPDHRRPEGLYPEGRGEEGTDARACYRCGAELPPDTMESVEPASGEVVYACEDCGDRAVGAKPEATGTKPEATGDNLNNRVIPCPTPGCSNTCYSAMGRCAACSSNAEAQAAKTRKPRSDKGKPRKAVPGAAKEMTGPPVEPPSAGNSQMAASTPAPEGAGGATPPAPPATPAQMTLPGVTPHPQSIPLPPAAPATPGSTTASEDF